MPLVTRRTSTNGTGPSVGAAQTDRRTGAGPAVWLTGDPEDLKVWMDRGVAGIVINTVVLNQMVQKYGQITDVVQRYLDITDKPVVVEIDGHTTDELLAVGEVFTRMSEQVILKIPCTPHALGAFAALQEQGVKTYCTTVFSLAQAAAVARAGVTHILSFLEPVKDMGGDPTQLVRECVQMFAGWDQRPYITAALVRSVESAHAALRDGADGIIVFWPIFEEMMKHPLTDQWNQTFLDEWIAMRHAGLTEGVPITLEY